MIQRWFTIVLALHMTGIVLHFFCIKLLINISSTTTLKKPNQFKNILLHINLTIPAPSYLRVGAILPLFRQCSRHTRFLSPWFYLCGTKSQLQWEGLCWGNRKGEMHLNLRNTYHVCGYSRFRKTDETRCQVRFIQNVLFYLFKY